MMQVYEAVLARYVQFVNGLIMQMKAVPAENLGPLQRQQLEVYSEIAAGLTTVKES
jgi:hypothetical protein